MPNWCSNTLYITGCAVEATAIRSLLTTARSKFDFRAIVPMPDEIEQSESSSKAETAWQLKYGDWHDATHKYGPEHYPSREAAMQAAREADDWRPMFMATRDNPFSSIPARSFDELADAVQVLIVKHGHKDWYSWACDNWGTKWSAADAGWMSPARAVKRESHQVAYFNTAWGPPVPIIIALSERFPDAILRLEYCEHEGGFRGFITFAAGAESASKHENFDIYEESIGLSHYIKETHDYRPVIYIGPGRQADANGPAFAPSRWANPFADGHRDERESCSLFRRWLLGEKEVIALLPSREHDRPSLDDIRERLLGTTLLCDCGGRAEGCHGYVLMDVAFGRDGEEENCDDDERDQESPMQSDLTITGQ
jgi:hypothetical protein